MRLISRAAGVRTEVVVRQNKTITPKLHLLEAHTVPCMRTFGVALGLLGEQGGEGIHHRFNQIRASLENVPSDLDRLRLLLSSNNSSQSELRALSRLGPTCKSLSYKALIEIF